MNVGDGTRPLHIMLKEDQEILFAYYAERGSSQPGEKLYLSKVNVIFFKLENTFLGIYSK